MGAFNVVLDVKFSLVISLFEKVMLSVTGLEKC